jgi:hypothetical protein
MPGFPRDAFKSSIWFFSSPTFWLAHQSDDFALRAPTVFHIVSVSDKDMPSFSLLHQFDCIPGQNDEPAPDFDTSHTRHQPQASPNQERRR